MRYQQYKSKMKKIRGVIDFFYRFRFVFGGVVVAITAGAIALDVSKGNITETTDFEVSYKYGEGMTYSGEAFMGNVTYEFRRKGDTEWSEEEPTYVGDYEVRAKSEGNHGYKYSDISEFTIDPIDVTFSIKENTIEYGANNATIEHTALSAASHDYIATTLDTVSYTVDNPFAETSAVAKADLSSLKILNDKNEDVTECYNVINEAKELAFTKRSLTIAFKDPEQFTYTGNREQDKHQCDEFEIIGQKPLFDADVIVPEGINTYEIGTHANNHKAEEIKVIGPDGTDYTENYNITVSHDNSIVINKAEPITVTALPLEKVYDGKPFEEEQFTYTVDGQLLDGHRLDVEFTNTDVFEYTPTAVSNSLNAKIVDEATGEDVTSVYKALTPIPSTIKINKRPVYVSSPSSPDGEPEIFNNKPKDVYNTCTVTPPTDDEGVVEGDKLFFTPVNSSPVDPGEYENKQTYEIWHVETIDDVETKVSNRTNNYTINPTTGHISIVKTDPIKIKFTAANPVSDPLTYDAESHPVYINNGVGEILPAYANNLPEGFKVHAQVYASASNRTDPYLMTNAGDYTANETMVDCQIYDADDVDVTSKFIIDTNPSDSNDANCDVTFEFETSHINKRLVTVEVEDYNEITEAIEFNNKGLNQNLVDTTEPEKNLAITHKVHASGLQGDDKIKITPNYGSNTQYVGKHTIGVSVEVVDKNNNPMANNYTIEYKDEKDSSDVWVTKRHALEIYTPVGAYKTYDGNDDITSTLTFTNNGTLNESVTLNSKPNNEKYKVLGVSDEIGERSFDAGNRSYHFEVSDFTIKINNVDVTDQYEPINIVYNSTYEIRKRSIEYSQVSSTKNYIYYDKLNHGVYGNSTDGFSSEVEITHEQANKGLLESLGHTFSFYGSTYYTNAVTNSYYYSSDNNNFNATVFDDLGRDITCNYEITPASGSDPFHINIIKKQITITSGSKTKTFDGNKLDLYTSFDHETAEHELAYYPITDFSTSQFTYTIKGYNNANVSLNDGHHIEVTKTDKTILDATVNCGNYINQYNFKVVDGNGNNVEDFYDITINYGSLDVYRLYINTSIGGGSDEYKGETMGAGKAFNPPTSSFEVKENTSSKGAYLSFSKEVSSANFDKNVFYNNFYIQANFEARESYPDYFKARNYYFDATFGLYTKAGSPYSNDSNVILSPTLGTFTYRISKVSIKITLTNLGGGREMRIVSEGNIVSGDTLYFGVDEYIPKKAKLRFTWSSTFDINDVRVMRNSVDVTDCYNISVAS